jgi:hypothetical protein
MSPKYTIDFEMVIMYMKKVDFEAIPFFKVLRTRAGSKHLKT